MPTDLGDYAAFVPSDASQKTEVDLGDYAQFVSPQSSTPETDKAVATTASIASQKAVESSQGPPGYRGKGEFAPEAGAASVPLASKMLPAEKQEAERVRSFYQGAGVPTSIPEAKEAVKFLVRSPVQDVKDIYQGITEIPGKVADLKHTIATSPAATVIKAPLSPEAFQVYGTTAAMLAPGLMKGVPDASKIGSATEVPVREVRPGMGQETPLRQSGEAPQAQNLETPQNEPVGVEGTLAELKRKNQVTPGEVTFEKEKNEGQQEAQIDPEKQVLTSTEPAAVSGPESPPAAAPPTEPVVSAIANKYTQERTKAGDLGKITPGQVSSVQELATRGQKLVEGGADVDAAVSRVMSGTFDPVDDVAIVRFQEAGLRARKDQAYRDLKADPQNVEKQLAYENAFKDLTDFHQGPIATVKTNWAQQGRGLQGQFPVDLTTADGLREAWLQNTGKDMPESVRPVAEKVASRVRETVDSENGVKSKLGTAIEDAYAKRTTKLTHEQIRDRYLKELEERPCL